VTVAKIGGIFVGTLPIRDDPFDGHTLSADMMHFKLIGQRPDSLYARRPPMIGNLFECIIMLILLY
jgi:hypothetical protein